MVFGLLPFDHDHQDLTFRLDRGDAVVARFVNGEWIVEDAFDGGHDGWDARLAEMAVEAAQAPLGQILDLAVDESGRWRVAFSTIRSKSPLRGDIYHALRARGDETPLDELTLTGVALNAGELGFEFETRAGAVYCVQASSDLGARDWTVVEEIQGDGSTQRALVSVGDAPYRLFRVAIK